MLIYPQKFAHNKTQVGLGLGNLQNKQYNKKKGMRMKD